MLISSPQVLLTATNQLFDQTAVAWPRMTMLQDSVRMQAYRNAIETSVADFRDKAQRGHWRSVIRSTFNPDLGFLDR